MLRDIITPRNHGLIQSDVDRLTQTMVEAGRDLIAQHDQLSALKKAKDDGSPQTEGDLYVEQKLKAALSGLKAGYPIISEEHEAEVNRGIMDIATKEDGYVWVIDPIDGTKSYCDGRDEYTINVALLGKPDADGNRTPLFGAVYAPAKNEFYFTGLDGKAYQATPKEGELKVEGFGASLFEPRSKKQLHCTQDLHANGQFPTLLRVAGGNELEGGEDIFSRTTAISPQRHTGAYRTMMAARGTVDAAIFNKPSAIWDIAAADAIMRAAGGRAFPIQDGKVVGDALYYGAEPSRYSNGNLFESGPYISNSPALFEVLQIPTTQDVLIGLGSKGRA